MRSASCATGDVMLVNLDPLPVTQIPYAQAPTGARRFAAPVAAAPFASDFDARNPGAYCPQDAARGLGANLVSQSDLCTCGA